MSKIIITKNTSHGNICVVYHARNISTNFDIGNGKRAEDILKNAQNKPPLEIYKRRKLKNIYHIKYYFRMNEIEFILSDLNRDRYRSDQIEKNVEKWFKKILKHLYDYSCSGEILIKLTRVILIKVKDLNLNRILGPLIGGWVTELLQKSVTAKNHTIYLSIIALFLR